MTVFVDFDSRRRLKYLLSQIAIWYYLENVDGTNLKSFERTLAVSSEWLEKRLAKDGTSNHHKGEDDEWPAQPEIAGSQPTKCGTEWNHAP